MPAANSDGRFEGLVNLKDSCMHTHYCMKETGIEVETVRAQAKLFASFRQQLVRQAARYHGQGKPELEEILQEALYPG